MHTLDAVVDRLSEAQFYNTSLPASETAKLVAFVVARQGGDDAYAGSFALTPAERRAGIRVFTGERMMSASARHIIGEECCRVLLGLRRPTAEAGQALHGAGTSLADAILPAIDQRGRPGVFCCGKCTASFWRHVAAGGFNERRHRLANGMAYLKRHRDGAGGWRRFPFYYTLLALTEIGPDLARAELHYAGPVCQRRLARKPGHGTYARRRHDVMKRAMALI